MGKATNTRTAVNTENTMVNVDNGPECHALRALTVNMSNTRIAAAADRIVETARRVQAATGIKMLASNGTIRCTDGKFRPRGVGQSSRAGKWDLGHDLADDLDGPFCTGCNLYPQEGRDNGTSGLARITFAPEFPLEAWKFYAQEVNSERIPAARVRRMVGRAS